MAVPQINTDQGGYWMAFPMSSPPLLDTICSSKVKGGGDLSTLADDAPVKVRKPYTITKQRERWTEEEHQKFLDALKLHGRAWRRIEEHIGTKTAVQIRSHAQKFFSKLEREASVGGPLATSGSGEIEIPPPRPKRKPSHPYPKKACGAYSGSPSFEEDCKSPPAVHSAFTPIESGTGASISKMPLKTFGSSATSLRLFGQNVVPGSDKMDVNTELVESTGSPRSQASVENEETSGVSPLASNTGSVVWDQNASVAQLHETAGALFTTNTQVYQAGENCVDISSKTNHSNENHALSNEGCYRPWQPSFLSLGGHHSAQFSASVPTFWQGLVPPGFAHATSEDVNAAAAIAAATYAVASVWQVIQGALVNANNEGALANAACDTNVRTVYSPIAMLAAARNPTISRPQPPDSHTHGPGKRKQGHNDAAIRNEDENGVCGEETTAECCSGVTDEGGGPAKKCCRNSLDDDMHLDTHAPESPGIIKWNCIAKVEKPALGGGDWDVAQRDNSALAICSSASDDHMDAPSTSNKGRIEGSSVNELFQSENDTAKISVLTNGDYPLQSTIQVCGLDSPLESNQSFQKGKGAFDYSNVLGKENVSSSEVLLVKENITRKPNECSSRSLHDSNSLQAGGEATSVESERLFMIRAGATLSPRYSGTGFLPYKKFTREELGEQA